MTLSVDDRKKVLKYCGDASVALRDEDRNRAISNLTNALRLLKTGKDKHEVWSTMDVTQEDYEEAFHYCIKASDALKIEDLSTAMRKITYALNLLTPGEDNM